MQAKGFRDCISKYKYLLGSMMLIAISIIFACFVFDGAYIDLAKSGKLAWEYIVHFFNFISGGAEQSAPPVPPAPPTGGGDSGVPILPTDYAILIAKLKVWGLLFITGQAYTSFFTKLMITLTKILTIAMIVVPLFLLTKKLVCKLYFIPNTKHGQQTLPLRLHMKISNNIYYPVSTYIKGLVSYIKDNSVVKALLIVVWLLNLNIITICLPLIPFYFYFVFSFDIKALYDMVRFIVFSLKYIAILSPAIIVPVLIYVVDKWRLKHAVNKLQKFEEYNQEVLSKRDISTFKWGTMGTRKTMTLTDEALSISVIDTNKAEELKSTCRNMFPHFQWLLFELDIEKNIKSGIIYNWASCIDYCAQLETDFYAYKNDLFSYDYYRYSFDYYNGIAVNNLFKVLADYAKLHFLYIFSSSFIISNYAIREDKEMYTKGNSVRWDCDFFNFDKDFNEASYYSKILNFDILRMGRKIHEELSNDSLEFGIICIAEADKEQMNAVETMTDSVDSPYANPKNDGITKTEKFIRHRATIMGYCFAHILKDGQRVMSINADTRELSTLEHMLKPSKEKNTLPFFSFEKGLYTVYSKIYDRFDSDIRYYRGDDTLLHYLMTCVNKKLYDMYYMRKNRYGYVVIHKELEAGTLDKSAQDIKLYQCNAKVYSDRYRTDSHSAFFEEKARGSHTGIMQYESYGSTKMTDNEFAKQNSYSRLNMTNVDWKKPFIEKAKQEKAIRDLEAKEHAKQIVADKKKAEKDSEKSATKEKKEINK